MAQLGLLERAPLGENMASHPDSWIKMTHVNIMLLFIKCLCTRHCARTVSSNLDSSLEK